MKILPKPFKVPKRFRLKKLFNKWTGYLVVVAIVVAAVFLYFFVFKDIPSTTNIGRSNYPQSTKIYDRNGTLLYTIYASQNQTFVPLSKIPKNLQHATIAIEDKDFYKHGAVDIRGITRATYQTLFKKRIQGGSTLTQQLVKTTLLTPEQTVSRKIKEVILSFVVEATHSKNAILEMYLNQVPYGGTAVGVQAASYAYFGKPVWKLDLAQSAYLAALPEAPSLYSPFGARPEIGKRRQEDVLRKMREQGYISKGQEEKAMRENLTFSTVQDKIQAPHFVFFVKDLLVQKYGEKMVEEGGLSVTTTLDLPIQNFAQDAIATEVAKLSPYNVTNGAAVVTAPSTGEILAMVGSTDYFDIAHDGNVNVAIAKRQPGSSIKPINYATGLIKGFTTATPFVDSKICFPQAGAASYCPVNYDGKFHGVQQMRNSLANSFNIPAVKMLKANTVESMIATASAMGITSFDEPDRYGLSLTLGGGEVTMTQMAEAFGVFANNGYKHSLHAILKVTDSKGKVLEKFNPPTNAIFGKQVLPDGVAYIISDILADNGARSAAFGASSPLRIKNYHVSVKTGTTNDFRDNWTIGYTPKFVVTTWVGNNNNTPMRGIVSGVSGAAPIWHTIMAYLIDEIDKTPPLIPQRPDSVVGATICATSGLLPQAPGSPYVCPTRYDLFLKGTVPRQVDSGPQKVFVDKGTQDLAGKDQHDNVEEKDHVIVTDLVGDRYCVDCPHPELLSPTPAP